MFKGINFRWLAASFVVAIVFGVFVEVMSIRCLVEFDTLHGTDYTDTLAAKLAIVSFSVSVMLVIFRSLYNELRTDRR
jgi:hypothetical protein